MNIINLLSIKITNFKALGAKMSEDIDRVVTFSVPPTETKKLEQIKKLKAHSKRTGISFSHLVIEAIIAKNKELQL